MSRRRDQMRKCAHARKGKGKYRCGSDWCPRCGEHTTDAAVALVMDYLRGGSDTMFHTVLLEPCASYAGAVMVAEREMERMNAVGIEAIWWLEIGAMRNRDTLSEFWHTHKPTKGQKYLAHLHGVSRESLSELVQLYAAKRQVVSKEIKQGGWARSWQENVSCVVRYMRKRHNQNLLTSSWLDQATDEQWCDVTGWCSEDYSYQLELEEPGQWQPLMSW